MVILVTGGVFDVLHNNHRKWIQRCIEVSNAESILLLVHSDITTAKTKGSNRPLFTYLWRVQDLEVYLNSLGIPYSVVPTFPWKHVLLNKKEYTVVLKENYPLLEASNIIRLSELPGTHTSDIPKVLESLEQQSNCKNLQVGAVLVRNGEVVATGFNGSSTCDKCHNNLSKYCTVPHAEEQVLPYSLPGDDLFISNAPCIRCAIKILQAGIRRVVYLKDYRFSEGLEFLSSRIQIRKAGL